MEDIKKYIQSKLNNIEAELKRAKSNKVNFIAQKNQLLDMLFLIEIYEKYDISITEEEIKQIKNLKYKRED